MICPTVPHFSRSAKPPLDVTRVEIIRSCGIIVSFSDNTQAAYTSEELGYLRPYRIPQPERVPQPEQIPFCGSSAPLS
jgi:hypothetical protein